MNSVPTINVAATGAQINALRKAAGMPVKVLQGLLGLANPQAIYKWQNGTSLPSLDNLVVLAAALNVGINDIIVVNQPR